MELPPFTRATYDAKSLSSPPSNARSDLALPLREMIPRAAVRVTWTRHAKRTSSQEVQTLLTLIFFALAVGLALRKILLGY